MKNLYRNIYISIQDLSTILRLFTMIIKLKYVSEILTCLEIQIIFYWKRNFFYYDLRSEPIKNIEKWYQSPEQLIK